MSPDVTTEELPATAPAGAIAVLRRALRTSPGLLRGVRTTVMLALFGAAGRVVVPVLVQQVLDRGILGEEGVQVAFVAGATALAALLVLAVMGASRFTY